MSQTNLSFLEPTQVSLDSSQKILLKYSKTRPMHEQVGYQCHIKYPTRRCLAFQNWASLKLLQSNIMWKISFALLLFYYYSLSKKEKSTIKYEIFYGSRNINTTRYGCSKQEQEAEDVLPRVGRLFLASSSNLQSARGFNLLIIELHKTSHHYST